MSGRAKATIFAATSFCASRSRSEPWRARCLRPSRGLLANRPGPDQPRQEADGGKQRVPLLPRLQADVCSRVAVDLPRNVVGAACKCGARLRQARYRQELSLEPAPAPARFRSPVDCGGRRFGETDEALAVGIDNRRAPAFA